VCAFLKTRFFLLARRTFFMQAFRIANAKVHMCAIAFDNKYKQMCGVRGVKSMKDPPRAGRWSRVDVWTEGLGRER
jgi:hypothetical protein